MLALDVLCRPLVPTSIGQHCADFLYSIDWRAEQAAGSGSSLPPAASGEQQRKAAWAVRSDNRSTAAVFHASAARAAGDVAAATADALELLQRRLPGIPAGGSLALHVAAAPCALPTSAGVAGTAAAAATALSALVKVAAMEFAGASVGSSSADATAPVLALAPADAFGAAASGGAALRAVLQRQPLPALPPNSHLMPRPRGNLANLRLVPRAQQVPGTDEVQASRAALLVG